MNQNACEIAAFLLCIAGWVLTTSTLPIEFWKVSTITDIVIVTGNFYSNLWKICVHGSTGVSDCKDFESLLALPVHIQVCRAFLITGVILCFLGVILALVGMKCTKIGGSDITKAKFAFTAGIHFIVGGLLSMSCFSLYANRITSEFYDAKFYQTKYELGAGLFIGWAGSLLCIVGGILYCIATSKVAFQKKRKGYINKGTAITNEIVMPTTQSKSKQFDRAAYI
ncbi:claudin-10-like [Huso huso]|uniref:Claudin n=1 Tax=Huso huso TaxID=61971 RepID=A0ABR0ZLP2_HUSHU